MQMHTKRFRQIASPLFFKLVKRKTNEVTNRHSYYLFNYKLPVLKTHKILITNLMIKNGLLKVIVACEKSEKRNTGIDGHRHNS